MFSSLHCYQFIKSSQVCTSDTRIYFAVKLPDGVILDKTMPGQVTLHHAIFVEKFVLATIAQTNGALPT